MAREPIPVARPDSERSAEKKTQTQPAAAKQPRETEGRRRGSAPGAIVHSQVKRIREEDLRIGDGAGEGLRGARATAVPRLGTGGGGGAALCSRPWMLPCSPLGHRAAAM